MLSYERLNAYRTVWLMISFDLPVLTQTQRKRATRFRQDMLKDGFSMHQYSIYVRCCGSGESADVHTQRIKALIPKQGHVSIMRITDKQYSQIINVRNYHKDALPAAPKQLELF